MRHYLLFCLLLGACVSSSCTKKNAREVDASKWIKHTLDNKWVFTAPKDTKIVYLKGVDSVPGNIILSADSIKLEFDSGFEMSAMDTICNLGSEALHAKHEIERGSYKYLDKPDTLHNAQVDTVNGKIATIITPMKTGRGTTDISISDCKSHTWIGIRGKNIPASKQELVLTIYRSLQQADSK